MRTDGLFQLIGRLAVALLASAFAPMSAPISAAVADAAPVGVAPTDGVDRYAAGNVIVTFEGGDPGTAIGVVFRIVADQGLLKTRSYVIQPGDSPCAIIVRDYPSCDELLKLVRRLNPALTGKRGFQIGDTLLLPDIPLRSFRKNRAYLDVLPGEQAKSRSILNNWKQPFNAQIVRKSERGTVLGFDAYDIVIATPDPEKQKALVGALRTAFPPPSPNVKINPLGWEATEAKVYGAGPDSQRQACQQGAEGVHVNYLDYATTDADLLAKVLTPPPDAIAPIVYIIDVKLDPTPNLEGAIEGYKPVGAGDPARWKCTFAGDLKPFNHATHLASIIASRDNGYGFTGIAPTAQIVNYDVLQPSQDRPGKLEITSGNAQRLADTINTNTAGPSPPPRIYLLAGDLQTYARGALDRVGQVRNPPGRFPDDRPVEQAIRFQSPLFVVAAGQEDDDTPGVELTDRAPLSPQNLGDLRNVIVVSACQDCSRSSPTLMKSANFSSSGDRRFVQVAAPGGKPILGWLGAAGVGEGRGTSQAAAFTAGVVARMMSYYWRYYSNPYLVKTRLQVTSWPIIAHVGAADDYSRLIATGLVDPTLAWLDPSKTWLKTSTQGWREVRLKPIGTDLKFSGSSMNDTTVASKGLARIVMVSDADPERRWVVYRDLFRENNHNEAGSVARTDAVTIPDGSTLQLCGETSPMPMTDIVDLIIPLSGVPTLPCP